MTEELPTIEIVYLGRCTLSDGKDGAMWIDASLCKDLDNAEAAMKSSSPFAIDKKNHHFSIGNVYSVKGELDENKIVQRMRGKPAFLSAIDHKHHIKREHIEYWEAQDQAWIVAKRAKKMHDKVLEDSKLADRLQTLHRSYINSDKWNKLALEVVVLNIMRNGR